MKKVKINYTYIAGITASISWFICGNVLIWPAIARAGLSRQLHITTNATGYGHCEEYGLNSSEWSLRPHNHITMKDLILMRCCLAAGSILSPFPTAYSVNKVGHKNSLISCMIPFLLSWILLFLTRHFVIFILSRFVGGIGIGMAFTACPLYVSDISDIKRKDKNCCFMAMMLSSGIFFTSIGGVLESPIALNLIHFTIPVLFFVLMCFMPESPYFFLLKEQDDIAEWELFRLRGTEDIGAVRKEFTNMKHEVKKYIESAENGMFFLQLKRLFKDRVLYNCMFLCFGLHLIQHLSGYYITLSFFLQILEDVKSTVPSFISAIMLNASGPFVCLIYLTVVDKVKHWILLLISTIMLCLILVIASICLIIIKDHDWVYEIISMAHSGAFYFGLSQTMAMLWGDLFSFSDRRIACSLGILFTNMGIFITSAVFLELYQIKNYCPFVVFSVMSLIGPIFVYIFFLETGKVTRWETEQILKYRSTFFWMRHRNNIPDSLKNKKKSLPNPEVEEESKFTPVNPKHVLHDINEVPLATNRRTYMLEDPFIEINSESLEESGDSFDEMDETPRALNIHKPALKEDLSSIEINSESLENSGDSLDEMVEVSRETNKHMPLLEEDPRSIEFNSETLSSEEEKISSSSTASQNRPKTNIMDPKASMDSNEL